MQFILFKIIKKKLALTKITAILINLMTFNIINSNTYLLY